LAEAALPRPATRGNRVTLKAGQPEAAVFSSMKARAIFFRAENLSSGKPVPLADGQVICLPDQINASAVFVTPRCPSLSFTNPEQLICSFRPWKNQRLGSFSLAKRTTLTWVSQSAVSSTLDEPAGQKLLVIFAKAKRPESLNSTV